MLKYPLLLMFIGMIYGVVAKCPEEFELVEMTLKMQSRIVQTHNALRDRAAMNRNIGPISNMNYVNWKFKFMKIAEKLNKDCLTPTSYTTAEAANNGSKSISYNALPRTSTISEDPPEVNNEQDEDGPKTLGVNWGDYQSYIFPKSAPSHLIRNWFLEGKYITKEILTKMIDGKGNNFTQLLWAKTKFVGCSMALFRNVSPPKYRLLCVYYPQGNIIDEAAYLLGVPCSECESHVCNPIFSHLCGKDVAKAGNIRSSYKIIFTSVMSLILLSY